MPPPTPNAAQAIAISLLGGARTGPQANIPGVHNPRGTLSTLSSLTTSAVGQTFTGLQINGNVTVNHAGTVFNDCEIRGRVLVNMESNLAASARFNWCKLTGQYGSEGGNDGSGISRGNFTLYRCEVRSYKDLIAIWYGTGAVVECWIHSPWDCRDDFFGGGIGSAHPDPIQFFIVDSTLNNDPDYTPKDWLFQSSRFDSWPYLNGEEGGPGGDGWEQLSGHGSATSGFFICNPRGTPSVLAPERLTWRDCYIDGRYDNGLYLSQSSTTTTTAPKNARVFDNIWKKRTSAWGFGGGSSTNKIASVRNVVTWTWGRNLDADTGEEIPANGGTQLTPGPGTQYPTWYTDGEPDPGDPDPPPPPPPEDGVAPSWVSAGTVYETATRGEAGAPGLPAGLADGYGLLLIQQAHTYGGGSTCPTLATPDGYTNVLEQVGDDASNTRKVRLRICRRQHTTGDSAPSVAMGVDGSGTEYLHRAWLVAVSGQARDGNPIDVTTSHDPGATGSLNVTGVTTTAALRLVTAVIAACDDNSVSAYAMTDPASLTERLDSTTTTGADGGTAIATGVRTTAGATGNLTATLTASDPIASAVLAIRPPPFLSSVTPAGGSTAIAIGTNVVATFSEVMDDATIDSDSMYLTPSAGGSPVAAAISFSSGDTVATLNPSSDLTAGTAYTLTLTSDITDAAGNTFDGATVEFTTAGASGPPAEVVDLTLSEPSAGTIRAAFTAPANSDVSAYLLRYKVGDALETTFTDETDGTQFAAETATTAGASVGPVDLAGFDPGDVITVAVFIKNTSNEWNDGATEGITLDTTDDSTDVPSDVALTVVAGSSVRFVFTLPIGADGWRVNRKDGFAQTFADEDDGTLVDEDDGFGVIDVTLGPFTPGPYTFAIFARFD